MRSEANFAGAFTDPHNLVVGPLALVGAGEPTPPRVVAEFGGQKFPLLVRAGHTVTVQIRRAAQRFAGLAYGSTPSQRPLRLRDAHHTITFVACRRGEPSGSSADGAVTFWSGFVVVSQPACVPLEILIDNETAPRLAVLSLRGRRC